MTAILYSTGDCPVCLDSGAVIALKGTDGIFFYCPLCETAWQNPPRLPNLDSVDSLTAFTRARPTLPTEEEIRRSLYADVVHTVPVSEWLRFIREHVDTD
jgi:hypothetical protein